MSKLTPREREIVTLLAQGVPQREIARRLCVSVHTVYFHTYNARCKFDALSTLELAIKAARPNTP